MPNKPGNSGGLRHVVDKMKYMVCAGKNVASVLVAALFITRSRILPVLLGRENLTSPSESGLMPSVYIEILYGAKTRTSWCKLTFFHGNALYSVDSHEPIHDPRSCGVYQTPWQQRMPATKNKGIMTADAMRCAKVHNARLPNPVPAASSLLPWSPGCLAVLDLPARALLPRRLERARCLGSAP